MRRNWQKYMIDETPKEPFDWDVLLLEIALAVVLPLMWRGLCWAAIGLSLRGQLANPFWGPPLIVWTVSGLGLLLTRSERLGGVGAGMFRAAGYVSDAMYAIAKGAVKVVRVVVAILLVPLIPIALLLPGFAAGTFIRGLFGR